MKNSAKNLLTLTLAALGLSALSAQAQGKITDLNEITVALKMEVQGSFSDNGSVRVYAKPVMSKQNTKDLLNQIGRDKYAQGQYTANTFPGGAKLGLSAGRFVVVNASNQLLVDASDILQFSRGTNTVLNGRLNDSTGLAATKVVALTFVTVTFDDTFIAGGSNTKYVLTGVDTLDIQDKVLAGNKYSERTSDSVKNAAGEGRNANGPFVVTGSLRGSYSGTLPIPVP
jgi:hypothetical protein